MTNLAKFESFLLVRGEFSTAFPFFICAKTLRLSGLVYYLVCMSLYREQQRVICGINGLNSIQQPVIKCLQVSLTRTCSHSW